MYQIQFTLKQHTPIIHFQHDQDGATLRASEVKPKLDRFIIENCGGKDQMDKSWFNNFEKGSLDYKLRISPNYSAEEEILSFHKNAPMYFGNMGNENPPKHFKSIEETEVYIICFSNELKTIIQENISFFFFKNNFGTRQSKGYGSFQVIKINGKEEVLNPIGHNFYFSIPTGDWQEALYNISIFYKVLRSGINEVTNISYNNPSNNLKAHKQQNTSSKFYFKSLIFLYSKYLKKQWDKKTIKENYFNNYSYRPLSYKEKSKPVLNWGEGDIEFMEELGLIQQINKYPNSEALTFSESNSDNHFFLDFKDIFGLSNSEQWKSYGKTIIKKNAENKSTTINFSDKSIKSSDFVERFASPLFFKPIQSGKNEFKIYVSYNELPNTYKGQKFIVYNNTKGTNPKLCLQIPTNFTFKDFFDFIFDKSNFNIDNHINNPHKNQVDINNFNTNYYEALKSIFDQLQTK